MSDLYNSERTWQRREILHHAAGLIAGAGLMGLAGCGGGEGTGSPPQASAPAVSPSKGGLPNLKGTTLTLSSTGGAYQAAQETAWCKPFAAATGAVVRMDGPSYDEAKIKIQVESGNVSWDLIDQSIWWILAHQDWLERIDTSVVDASQLSPEFASSTTPYGVPNLLYSMVQMYDNKFAADPPKTWADFFDVEKYPGKRGFPTYAAVAPMEIALLANGTPPDKLYPMDIDDALAKLEPLKKHLVFYDAFANSSQQLESKQVVMSLMPSGRGFDAVKNGAEFSAQWNQSFTFIQCLVALKGGKNVPAAMELINFTLSPEAQSPIPELIAYGTVNPLAKPKLDALQTAYLPTTQEHIDQAILADPVWWSKNFTDAFKKYVAWQVG